MKRPDTISTKILARVQGDLPLEKRPFDGWAEDLGMEAHELVEELKVLKQKGVIREMKAVLHHKTAGLSSNAMVVWAVPGEKIEETGNEIALRQGVSHCYERPGFGEFNIFSMIHGRNVAEVKAVIEEIASSLHIRACKVYWSVKELKKSSMKYVREDAS